MNMIASRGQIRASYIRWSLLLVPVIILLGVVSAQFGGSGPENPWFAALEKPELYPPPWIFGLLWTVLYGLMGFSLALVLSAYGARGRGLATLVFVIQLVLALAWPPVFFGAHQITWALMLIAALDLAVLLMLGLFWRIRTFAALLLLPYLGWLLFATYLTWEIREANPDMEGQEISGAVQRYEF
ncbi:MAG: tryptophan-rich sensory protein [Sphingomonadaceae bacterium]|nr:tryptophan-rich sensory protein [Sphingomonadaceae bacterium]